MAANRTTRRTGCSSRAGNIERLEPGTPTLNPASRVGSAFFASAVGRRTIADLQRLAGNRATSRVVASPQEVASAGPSLVQRLKLDDPTVTSVRKPQWAPDGSFAWPVKMALGEAQDVRSWMVQQIELEDSDGTEVEFWEAFPVPARQTDASDQDIYQNSRLGSNGSSKVLGGMQAHRFTAGYPPPGLTQGAVEEADGEQFTSYKKPKFWKAGGTDHDLVFKLRSGVLDDTSTTVPDGGEWEKKDSRFQLDSG